MEELKERDIEEKNNEKKFISFLDLLYILWHRKWIIIGVTTIGAIFSLVYAIISIILPPNKSPMPNMYTPRAQMLISGESSGGTASLGNLGAIANIAGVSVSGGTSNSALAAYLVYSNTVLDKTVDQFDFINRWKILKSQRGMSREKLKKKLTVHYDDKTGVFTVSFVDKDPVLARDVVNYVVGLLEQRFSELGIDNNRLQKINLEENINSAYQEILDYQAKIKELENSVSNVYSVGSVNAIMTNTSLLRMELSVQEGIYKQLKTQYETLKVTMASEKPVFQVLEKAEVPDLKTSPSRGGFCIIVTFLFGLLSLFLVFMYEIYIYIRKNPEVLNFFKGNNK